MSFIQTLTKLQVLYCIKNDTLKIIYQKVFQSMYELDNCLLMSIMVDF